MEKMQGMTCNPKGLPKGPLTNIEDGLEQSVSDQAKERISNLLERIESLSDVEKLLLYLKLPTGSATEDVLRQTPTSFLYASNRLEQAQAFTWIRSHLEEDSQICVPKHEVYDDYRSYCESHGLKALCAADFGKVLKCIFPNVKPRRLGQRGQSRYCYSGLRKKLDVQPPSLPELEISPKKAKTEDLQENELSSASCQLVCEWAGKLLSRGFSSLRELAEFLVGNLYVNSKSTAAFTVLAAMQEAGLHNSRGGDKHRETQLQLQRKLQERELLKEQKKKLQQQRSEIEQEHMHSISRGPSATPTKSPLPRSFSKTPTPIKSPILRPPSSMALKSPGPVVSFRQTPTLSGAVQNPTKCVSRNITKLLQSPVQGEKPLLPPHDIKTEVTDTTGAEPTSVLVSMATSATSAKVSTATSAALSPSSCAVSTVAMSRVVEAGKMVVSSADKSSKHALMLSSVNGMNLLSGSNHQFIISGSQGLILDSEAFPSSADAAASIFKNGMHVVQKPVVMSASSGASTQQTVTAAQLQGLPVGSAASSMSHLAGSVSSLSGSVANLSGSMGNLSNGSSSASSFDSVHLGQSITIVSKPRENSAERTCGEIETIACSSDLERCRAESVNFIPGNLSTRSAFVPVSNPKVAFTFIAPNLSSAMPMSESSSDESKDQEEVPVPMDQSEALSSSGGFESQSENNKADMGVPPSSMQLSDSSSTSSSQSSLTLPNPSPQLGGQKKVKNRFTPIRPKAPQAQPPPTTFQKDQKTPEKDSRPVSALLKEKRAREAQEVLQHLASSFQNQASSSKSFPSSLSLPAEVLGLSPDKGSGGSDVVIILTSPSTGGTKVTSNSRDLRAGEERAARDKPGSLALSMSDILIANPNFVQKKELAATSTSQQQISVSYQPIARRLLTEKPTPTTSTDTAAGPTTLLGQVGDSDTTLDSSELGNTTDEEVTQHMNNSSFNSTRLLLPEGRGTDTPSSRKRKSSGQGSANQAHKRLNSATAEKRLEGEDDDVFIVDAPSESPNRRMVVQGQRLARHVLTRRLDTVSPYHRPGSTTLVDMQVDEPVSRCQSTGVGTDEVIYSALNSQLVVELSRQTHGKLNVESLESDALLDLGSAPPPALPSKQVVKGALSHRFPLVRGVGQKASVGTSPKDLVAAQQALLQEKQLLDARLDLFLNKYQGQGQQSADAPTTQVASSSADGDFVQKGSETCVSGAGLFVPVAYRTQARHEHATSQSVQLHPTSQSVQVHPTSQSVQVHPTSQSVQVHPASQLVQVHPSSQSIQRHPSSQSVQVHPTNQPMQEHPTSQLVQVHLTSQLLHLPHHSQPEQLHHSSQSVRAAHPHSQLVYVHPSSQSVQVTSSDQSVFSKLHIPSPGASKTAELSPSDAGSRSGQLQDASMNVDTFHMDANLNNFLDLVQGIVSSQTHTSSSLAGGVSEYPQQGQQEQHQVSKSESAVVQMSSTCSAAAPKSSSSSLMEQQATAAGSLIHSAATSRSSASATKSHAARAKSKSTGSQQPPPNTLLALLQSPVLSAISPSGSLPPAQSVKKASLDKLSTPVSSSQDQGGHAPQPKASHAMVAPNAAASSQASASLSPQQAAAMPLSNKQTQPNVSLMSGGTITQAGDSGARLGSLMSRLDSSFLPDSTRSLGPVPPDLPANFLDTDQEPELGGELPLDVADFVTDYSVKADLEQQQQQQQQQHNSLQLPQETLTLDKELQHILLQQNAAFLSGCVAGGESVELSAGLCDASGGRGGGGASELSVSTQKETFPMPSNPAPKQRLSESGSASTKKYPPVQRSASLPGLVPRGQGTNPQDVPPSPAPSPTREPSLSSIGAATSGAVLAQRVRQTMVDHSSSQTPTDGGYHSFDTSPLMPILAPLPPPVSTPSQEQLAMSLTSLRRNPMLSARSDSAQSVSSEGVMSLPQGSPQASQGALSNPGSVSACSPVDSATASPSAFMPIQVSPSSSSSSSSSAGVRQGLQQHYIQPIRPLVTVASVGVGSHEARNTTATLVSSSLSATGFASTRTQGLLGADDNLDLARLSQLDVGVVAPDLPQGASPFETSPASSTLSLKSEVGNSASRLMSASPCPGTVPYNAPSPRRHPTGISPGPSPTPATSNACSPSPSSAGHRASASHGVLQKLLSTRSAPPSYAESVQQRLMASGQLAGNQVIGGFVDQRLSAAGHASAGGVLAGGGGGGVRARTSSTQSRLSGVNVGTGSSHAGTSTEPAGQFGLPMMSTEDVKSSAKSVVHHTPTATAATSGTSTAGERSGRRIAILKRDSNTKPKSSSSSTPKVATAASDSILKASLASPPSPLDSVEYARPFSQKLLLLKQQASQSDTEGAMTGGQVKRQQGVASTASAVLVASLAGLKQGNSSEQAESTSKVPRSPSATSQSGKMGGGASSLAVQVSSPATPGSVSSAPSPASQGQGQMSMPLRISTSTPSHSDIFFGLPASSPSPRVHPFSPQQQSSSSSSSSSSSMSASNMPLGAMYLPFNLPDMNYMGNAPNIDLSQLIPGKTAAASVANPSLSQAVTDSSVTEFQGLDELHLTMDILRGIDGQYFIGQDVEGEDLMHNVFGDLTQDLHSAVAASSQDEEEGEEERDATTPRSRVRESSL